MLTCSVVVDTSYQYWDIVVPKITFCTWNSAKFIIVFSQDAHSLNLKQLLGDCLGNSERCLNLSSQPTNPKLSRKKHFTLFTCFQMFKCANCWWSLLQWKVCVTILRNQQSIFISRNQFKLSMEDFSIFYLELHIVLYIPSMCKHVPFQSAFVIT